jgi:hypothetical protein
MAHIANMAVEAAASALPGIATALKAVAKYYDDQPPPARHNTFVSPWHPTCHPAHATEPQHAHKLVLPQYRSVNFEGRKVHNRVGGGVTASMVTVAPLEPIQPVGAQAAVAQRSSCCSTPGRAM